MRSLRGFHGCFAALLVVMATSGPAHAAVVKTGHVEAELVADGTALVPGAITTVALRLAIEPGWHTYWRNPGESGLPTTLEWRLPPGYAAGAIEWPAPRALPVGPLMNYGYEGQVFHLVPLTVPSNAAIGTNATIGAHAEWLVCKETCIPEAADLTLALPVAVRGEPSRWHDAIAATRAALPAPLPAGWQAGASASGAVVTLTLTPPDGAPDPGRLQFFAQDDRRIEPSAPQNALAPANGRYALQLPVSHDLEGEFRVLKGVLHAQKGLLGAGGNVEAVALDLPIAGTPVAGPKPAVEPAPAIAGLPAQASGASTLSVPLALAFAFVGGLLLNLMPCVFPILSLKALGLAASQGTDRRGSRREAIAFAAGVVLAFAALGVALAGLRSAGEELGWGFQLQSPAVVASLAILFFVMALNLSGVFEFGALVPGGLAAWSHANRHVNAFASGVLAVAIASPCTAPFMGAALGYALGERTVVTLGVFVGLGLGMALPYCLLAWYPQWRRALPRPGAWMVRLKQLLAFPLYATVAWLVWVLAAQVGNDAVIRIGVALVLVAFALWAWRTWRSAAHRAWSGLAVIGALAAAFVAWPLFAGVHVGDDPARAQPTSGWQAYSPALVAELTAQGRAVFVDFTAAWCITCQVNERLVLNDASVRDAFARAGVALVRADWTRRDATISEALAALGRSGVPAYVIYRNGRKPLVLPEVLQRQTVIDALAS
ncbi:MAG TPA: thioredoxin family protein [Casimicrobiaceae bacterium]|nr:thioredoxin family protein [Casimicrobiaceae bacterium]